MITALLHTRNRPQFVLRALAHYNGRLRHPLYVLDASDAPQLEELQAGVDRLEPTYPLTVLHLGPEAPFRARLRAALDRMTSPYVMLLADDDLYYPEWIDEGIEYLDADPSCAVVYGHTVVFELDHFGPYGDVTRYGMWRPNPVARWLEAEAAEDRLTELGRGPWLNGLGWYAMQRTSVLRRILAASDAANFTGEMFERALTLLQPIYGRSVLLDTVYLARQANPNERRRPYRYAANAAALVQLQEIATAALVDASGMDEHRAARLIGETMRPEIAELKFHDRRGRLRIEDVKDRLPGLHRLVRRAKTLRPRATAAEPYAWDTRFPAQPRLDDHHPAIVELRASCRPSLVRRPDRAAR